MRLTVVRVRQGRGILVPIARMVIKITLDGRFNRTIEAFYLPVRLRVVCCRKYVADIQQRTDALKEL